MQLTPMHDSYGLDRGLLLSVQGVQVITINNCNYFSFMIMCFILVYLYF